jgi:uncharacterized membrane protein YccC
MSLAEQDAIARNTPEALIDRLGVAMTDLRAAIQHNTAALNDLVEDLGTIGETLSRIEQKLAVSGEARSSVQVEQGAKEVRLTVKTYADSPVASVGDEAISEFGRLFREVEAQQLNGWRDTVEGTQ